MPLTDTGYSRRTLADLVTETTADLRARISSKLSLTERTVSGNWQQIICKRLDELEQLAEEAYNACDTDNASDDRMRALAIMTGVPPRQPQVGRVTANIVLGAGFAGAAAGDLVAHVQDEPENRWVNRDALAAGAFTGQSVFVSEGTGSTYRAAAVTLTIIADGGVDGWVSITNAADAVPGTDDEEIEALRLRREQGVASGGSRTRAAIRAKLVKLDGVLSAEVFENTSSVTDAQGIPPKSFRAVIWDGTVPGADDDEIAQAIYDHGAEGILSEGTESGTATDPEDGSLHTVTFRRATAQAIEIAVNIQSDTGVSEDDVVDAILAAMPVRVGEAVLFNRLAAAVFRVDGVDDWVTFTIDGGTADLPAVQSRIYTLDSGDVSVSGDVS